MSRIAGTLIWKGIHAVSATTGAISVPYIVLKYMEPDHI